jgi:PiT family inorganic phosphate transporter
VKWGVAGRIIWAWVFTIPAAALMSVLVYGLSRLVMMAVR